MKITLGGKTVVLQFFVIFCVGDTEGYNDLCGHFQKKCNVSMQVLSLQVETTINVRLIKM